MNSTVNPNQLAEQSLSTLARSMVSPLGGAMLAEQALSNVAQLGNASGTPGQAQDGISRFLPTTQQMLNLNPLSNPFDPIGSLMTKIQTLMQMLQNALGGGNQMANGTPGTAFPGGFPGGSFPPADGFGDNESWFTQASAGSNGDPHLSFNGQTWDSMVPHPDLLHSDSIPGGYQVSTTTTAPATNGVTYNQKATVTTNFGNSSISLDNAGNALATIYGQQYNLTPGQSMDLGGGTTATRNQDGSVTVLSQNDEGGAISTTLRQDGPGVDVNASAQNVDLGGDLAAHQNPTLQLPNLHANPHHHHPHRLAPQQLERFTQTEAL